MGIKDDDKVIEQWLATIAPQAFYYRLPSGVVLSLVVQDLSALLVAAFMNTRIRTGHDFLTILDDPVQRFATAPAGSEDSKITWGENSLLTEDKPVVETLEEWRLSEPERFEVPYTRNARLVLTRDNSQHMPANRELVHEERYGGDSTNLRNQPFSEQEIRELNLHVCRNRPMPGVNVSTLEPAENVSLMRARANRTPLLRQAYQNYGPWALARSVRENIEHLASSKAEPNKRVVLIDSVLEEFPENYERQELWELPSDWTKKPHKTHIYTLDGQNTRLAECLNIGEADRKIVWYIETCSEEGQHVLIRSNDSDILFILLLNMHRFRSAGRGKESVWTRTIFLDMNTPNMKKERYQRRFVCLNQLMEALEDKKNPLNPLAGIPNPAHVITSIALLCGSDYTQNPYGLGATRIMDLFSSLCKNKSFYGELTAMIRLGVPDVEPDEEHEDMNHYPHSIQGLVLILMHEESFDVFLRRLYQTRLTQKTIKQFAINTSLLLTWPQLERYLTEQDSSKKAADDLRVPNAFERKGELRRLLWTLHYWSNCHHDFGDFPAPDLDHPETGQSIWGWSRCRKVHIRGEGQSRFINKTRIDLDRAALMRYETEHAQDGDKKHNVWICSKNNDIVDFDAIWTALGAEFIYRAHAKIKSIQTPLWKHQ